MASENTDNSGKSDDIKTALKQLLEQYIYIRGRTVDNTSARKSITIHKPDCMKMHQYAHIHMTIHTQDISNINQLLIQI